jgi:hypothetical protein
MCALFSWKLYLVEMDDKLQNVTLHSTSLWTCIVQMGPEDVRTQNWDKDKVRG